MADLITKEVNTSKERDIAARLRAAHPNSPQYALGSMLLSEAADEIERLRKFIVTRCIGSGGASDAERWHMINEWNKAKAAMSGEQPPRSAHETGDPQDKEQIRHLERRIRELTEQLNCMKHDAHVREGGAGGQKVSKSDALRVAEIGSVICPVCGGRYWPALRNGKPCPSEKAKLGDSFPGEK